MPCHSPHLPASFGLRLFGKTNCFFEFHAVTKYEINTEVYSLVPSPQGRPTEGLSTEQSGLCVQLHAWMRLCHSSTSLSVPPLLPQVLVQRASEKTNSCKQLSTPLPTLIATWQAPLLQLPLLVLCTMSFRETASSHIMWYTWRIQVSFPGYQLFVLFCF